MSQRSGGAKRKIERVGHWKKSRGVLGPHQRLHTLILCVLVIHAIAETSDWTLISYCVLHSVSILVKFSSVFISYSPFMLWIGILFLSVAYLCSQKILESSS